MLYPKLTSDVCAKGERRGRRKFSLVYDRSAAAPDWLARYHPKGSVARGRNAFNLNHFFCTRSQSIPHLSLEEKTIF